MIHGRFSLDHDKPKNTDTTLTQAVQQIRKLQRHEFLRRIAESLERIAQGAGGRR